MNSFTSGAIFFCGAFQVNVAVSELSATSDNDCGTVHGSKAF